MVQPFISEGSEPVRCCLQRVAAGERLALVSFSPFEIQNAFKEYGPIYVHMDGCPGLEDWRNFPTAFERDQLCFRAYSRDQMIVASVLAPGSAAHETVTALFGGAEVAHVDARFAGFGCFLTRFVRDEDADEKMNQRDR